MGTLQFLGVNLMIHGNEKTRNPIGVKLENYLDKNSKLYSLLHNLICGVDGNSEINYAKNVNYSSLHHNHYIIITIVLLKLMEMVRLYIIICFKLMQ